jgi:hypothetical protein
MPRILLSTAHLVPQVLEHLAIPYSTPGLLKDVPALPTPFDLTQERLDKLKEFDLEAYFDADVQAGLASSTKSFIKTKPLALEDKLETLAIAATA